MTEIILLKKFKNLNALNETEKAKTSYLNCCEHILLAGNEAFQFNLSETALAMAKGFGGGFKIESTCGALSGGVMVLGGLFNQLENFDEIIQDFMMSFKTLYKNIDCGPLKEVYRKEDTGCQNVILMVAKVLDKTIIKYRSL